MSLQADTFPLGRRDAPHPEAVCGPTSASWRLRRGGVVVTMAKARAALLQIAHPKIAAGLVDHSTFREDPYKRVRITGQTMSAILFGSVAERTEALRLLRRLHSSVRGTTGGGESYSASDPTLLWFVLATLIDSDLLVEERYLRIFTDRDRDQYFDESMTLVEAFRVPRSMVPRSRSELRAQVADACDTLTIDSDARRLGDGVFDPTFLRVPRAAVWGYRQLLADLLPPNVRAGYGLAEHPTALEHLVVAAARVALPRVPSRFTQVRLEPRQPVAQR